jgi:predicted ATPase
MIFISYAREDEEWKDKLLPHLGVLLHRGIEIWHDRTITTGSFWRDQIVEAIDRSEAAILLISAHFLNSDFIRESELPMLLDASRRKNLRLFPVIVRDCPWKRLDWLAAIQVCSSNGRPLGECDANTVDSILSALASEVDEFFAARAALRLKPAQAVSTNIPPPSTSFVGRKDELSALRVMLEDENIRLITITGPPGIGKTRLATQLGREMLGRFPGGCWFANLVEAVTVTGIAHAIFQAFGLSLSSGQKTQQEAIVELLQPREDLLLILDNFEQVVVHAGETLGYWEERLPRVRFVVTSREILSLSMESEYRLESLPVPREVEARASAGDLLAYESVQLFFDRARRVRADFQPDEATARDVGLICGTLQGIPLAIELAAARVRVYTARQISEKLSAKFTLLRATRRDQHDRQQTLFGSIDWSYQLLKPWEQEAFLQTCAFRGGFFLEAAEGILDLSHFPDAPPVCDVIQSLCEKSLLNARQNRFGLRFDHYVAIQDYGEETWHKTVTPEAQEALALRWASYYIPYAKAWNEKVHTADGGQALDRLNLELENLFGIQDWFLEHGSPDIAADAILAFAETMAVRGPAHLRVPRLGKSLAADRLESVESRIRLMTCLAAAHWSLGQWNEATLLADDAVELLPQVGRSAYVAGALRQQGRTRTDRGYLRRALESLEAAKKIYEGLSDPRGVAVIDTDMAAVFDRLGDLPRSLALLNEAENLVRGAGDDPQRALVLNRRGLALWHHGQPEPALACLEEAESINLGLGAMGWVAGHCTNQGLALTDLDRFDEAFQRFERAEQIHREMGNDAWAAVNYGGWGRALMMHGRAGDVERGLELIRKAEELSRKVYYPENISLHAGDRGRGLLMLGRVEEARSAVREAVALERVIGASRDLRHFCNLVTLARIEEATAHFEECRDAVLRAWVLKERLGIHPAHPVRKVREDLGQLYEIKARLGEQGELGSRISSLLSGCGSRPLTSAEMEAISTSVFRAFDESSYEYPWKELEEDLRRDGRKTIRLFGYGSLLNLESALRTFPGTAERFTPALAFGIVRLFNFEMPEAVRRRYTLFENPLERGLLNARVTGFMTDVANGILVEVGMDEIEALRAREVGYDLRPLACVPWERSSGAVPGLAYVLTCPDRLWEGRPLTNRELLPHRGYLRQCCEGAKSHSEGFQRFWQETTYLADGETCIATTTWMDGLDQPEILGAVPTAKAD